MVVPVSGAAVTGGVASLDAMVVVGSSTTQLPPMQLKVAGIGSKARRSLRRYPSAVEAKTSVLHCTVEHQKLDPE